MKMLFVLAALAFGSAAWADEMRLAVTTSFQNSGLSDILLPSIVEDTGIKVQLIVVGTGQAIRLGEAGDVDAILVHSREAEHAFLEGGFGTHRRKIMYNDFVVIGPRGDPAGIAEAASVSEVFQAIAKSDALFVSRGDDSGTHKKELALWAAAGTDKRGGGYRELGAGMGATLNTATGLGAYVLSDRASWLNFGNKIGMAILFEGDAALLNQYAYLPVNPEVHPHVKADLSIRLEDWLTSEKAQTMIGAYEILGQPLFVPNAEPLSE